MRRLLSGLAVAVVALIATAAPAAAHSDLEEASPGPGDDVAAGAASVHLLFGEGVADDDVNRVTLATAGGDAVAVGQPSVVDDGFGVCAATDALAPGEYVLDWRVMSEDGHPAQSRYSFEVTDAGSPVDAAACEGVDLAAPEAADDGFSVGTATIVGVGALALLVVVGLFVVRVRRDRRAA